MTKALIILVCALLLVNCCSSADNKLFLQAQLKGTYTDNVFLSPTKTSDFLTTAAGWVRHTVSSTNDSSVRLKADVKSFNWADGSFDSYTYWLLGADYRRSLGKHRRLSLAYGYKSNDSYDFEAPFHRFNGHELSAAYEFPASGKSWVELEHIFSTRNWDAGASGRDGTGNELRSTFSLPVAKDSLVGLVGRWEKVNTDDPGEEFTRWTTGITLTRYLRGRADGPTASLRYRYRTRDYAATTREDDKNSLALAVDWPVGLDTKLNLDYGIADNNSTFADRNYEEHALSFGLVRRF